MKIERFLMFKLSSEDIPIVNRPLTLAVPRGSIFVKMIRERDEIVCYYEITDYSNSPVSTINEAIKEGYFQEERFVRVGQRMQVPSSLCVFLEEVTWDYTYLDVKSTNTMVLIMYKVIV